MPIPYHPQVGTIVICDFRGFVVPEMVKRRPVIVVSPRLRKREKLCTVIPLSTTAPIPRMSYHYRLKLDEPLPKPYDSLVQWVKADMLATVSFDRLFLPYKRKDPNGKREYVIKVVEDSDLNNIRACMLHALALSPLTKYL